MPDSRSNLEIRVAERSDIQSLLKLYDQLHPDDPELSTGDAEKIWQQFQSYSGSDIFIGLEGGVLVTTCTLLSCQTSLEVVCPMG